MKDIYSRIEDKLTCSINGFTTSGGGPSNTGLAATSAFLGPLALLGKGNMSGKDFTQFLRSIWGQNPNSPYYGQFDSQGNSLNLTNPFTSGPDDGGNGLPTWLGPVLAGIGLSIPGIGGRGNPPAVPGGPSTPSTGGNTKLPSWLIPLLSGVAGGLNNRPTTSTTNMTFPSDVSELRTGAIDQFNSLLQDPDLTGYQANATENINNSSNALKQNTLESLANRGITGGAAAATASNAVDSSRLGQITTLKNSIPMLANQLKLGNLNAIQSFLTSNRGSTTTNSGNIAGGAVSGATQALLLQYLLGGGGS